jgi:hypothetical protein
MNSVGRGSEPAPRGISAGEGGRLGDQTQNDVDQEVARALRALDELARTHTFDLFRTSGGATLAAGLRAILTLLATSSGECRRAVPYSPLRPVLDVDGTLRWCCSHDPEHRV